jgi:hypothetical protein
MTSTKLIHILAAAIFAVATLSGSAYAEEAEQTDTPVAAEIDTADTPPVEAAPPAENEEAAEAEEDATE